MDTAAKFDCLLCGGCFLPKNKATPCTFPDNAYIIWAGLTAGDEGHHLCKACVRQKSATEVCDLPCLLCNMQSNFDDIVVLHVYSVRWHHSAVTALPACGRDFVICGSCAVFLD